MPIGAGRLPGPAEIASVRWRAFKAALVVSVLSMGTLAVPGPAFAAGDSALDSLIIPNPVSGWESMTQSDLESILAPTLAAAAKLPGTPPAVAVEGWVEPNSFHKVIVELIRFSDADQQALGEGSSDSTADCTRSQYSSVQTKPSDAAPGAEETDCVAQKDGTAFSVAGVVFTKGLIEAFVTGYGAGSGVVEQAAAQEAVRLPMGQSAATGGLQGASSTVSSAAATHGAAHHGIAYAIGRIVGIVVLVLLVIDAVATFERRKKSMSRFAEPINWPDDPTE